MKTESKDAIAINAVEIEIAGTKLKLTLEQITELKKILAEAFPEKETVYVPRTEIIHREYPVYPVPHWPIYKGWEITCQAEAGNSGTLCLAAH